MLNEKCPISGSDVSPKYTVTYDGQKVGFCSEQHARDGAEIISRLSVKPFWKRHLNLSSVIAFALGGVISALLW